MLTMATQLLTPEAIALTEKKMDMTLDEIIKMSKKPANKDKNALRHPVSSVKGQGSLNGIASQRGNKSQHFIDSRPAVMQGVLAQKRSNCHGNGNQFPLANNAAKRAAVMQTHNINFMPGRNSPRSWKNKPWYILVILVFMCVYALLIIKLHNTVYDVFANNSFRIAPVNTQRKSTDDIVVVKDTNAVQQRQQKPRTMDALFADMKVERTMMVFSSQRFSGRQQLQQQTQSGGFRSGEFSGHGFVKISNNYSR